LQCLAVCCKALQCVAVCRSALQCIAVCCSVLQCVAVPCSALQCVAVHCSVLQCVAVPCSALQCIAVCCMQSSPFFDCTTNVLHCPLIRATRRIHTCVICERVTSHTIHIHMIITSLFTHSTIL